MRRRFPFPDMNDRLNDRRLLRWGNRSDKDYKTDIKQYIHIEALNLKNRNRQLNVTNQQTDRLMDELDKDIYLVNIIQTLRFQKALGPLPKMDKKDEKGKK